MPLKTPSIALETRLADTFRQARTYRLDGSPGGEWPRCARCGDGRDVITESVTPLTNAWARRYRCRACELRFSDLSGTPLAGTQKPLATWALLAILSPSSDPHTPSWEALSRLTGVGRQRLTDMDGRLYISAFASRWQAALQAEGITAEQLVASFSQPCREAYADLAGNARSTSHVRTLRRRKA
ncbi:MAG: hypothetical protein AAB262_13890 [Elusimicrobiota bacterium]|mgnify:CR=1 FL=1